MNYTMIRYENIVRFNHQYDRIYKFLLEAADRGYNEHFHWGRFEWMMCHPMLEEESLTNIGMFLDEEEKMVGLVTYDTEMDDSVYLIHSSEDKELLQQMLSFACDQYGEKGSSSIKVNSCDTALRAVLIEAGYEKKYKHDNILEIDLSKLKACTVPKGYTISKKDFKVDPWKAQVAIHKGFNNEGLPDKTERVVPLHEVSQLRVFVYNEKEYCAHCGVWYTKGDTAYIEPVVTIPECRMQGLAKAVVYEALLRARELGATRGAVLSTQEFYYKIGFHDSSEFESWGK